MLLAACDALQFWIRFRTPNSSSYSSYGVPYTIHHGILSLHRQHELYVAPNADQPFPYAFPQINKRQRLDDTEMLPVSRNEVVVPQNPKKTTAPRRRKWGKTLSNADDSTAFVGL
jgi:hypothetical protein